jgi:hypothetical protein
MPQAFSRAKIKARSMSLGNAIAAPPVPEKQTFCEGFTLITSGGSQKRKRPKASAAARNP